MKNANKQKNSISGNNTSGLGRKIALIAVAAVVVIAAAVFIGIRVYYGSHWYPDTKIGDKDVSGMTLSESVKAMEKVYGSYQLDIKGRKDGKLTINGDDIDYKVGVEDAVKKAFEQQHDKFSYSNLFKNNDTKIEPKVSYDENEVDSILSSASIVKGDSSYQITAPVDAKAVYSKKKNSYQVVKEDVGNTLDKDKFSETVKTALDNGETSIDVSDEKKYPDIYEKPALTSNDKELRREVNVCNATALRWVTWTIHKGVQESATPEDISKWITYNNGKAVLDNQAMRDWMEKLCLKYKTLGGTRKFKSHTGKMMRLSGGDYGWQLDYEKMCAQLKEGVTKKISRKLQNAYIKNQDDASKKAITVTKKPEWLGTAYRYDPKNKMNDWNKNSYIEADLGSQMVYVFKNGKVIYSCATISGRPVPGRKTTTGMFFIKEHQRHRLLKGDNYSTPVVNWVRITWTGTGFHQAEWQPWGSWSPSLYKVKGSHGCLNLSPSSAARIYELTKYKQMVFMHY